MCIDIHILCTHAYNVYVRVCICACVSACLFMCLHVCVCVLVHACMRVHEQNLLEQEHDNLSFTRRKDRHASEVGGDNMRVRLEVIGAGQQCIDNE